MTLTDSHESYYWLSPKCIERLVSVIVPNCNRAAMICATLNSVFAQTYRPMELIIVDDGSKDESIKAINEWISGHDNDSEFECRLIQQENQGAPTARNRGLTESKGEFIQFLDSDDWLHSNKIECQVTHFKEHPHVSACYSPWRTKSLSSVIPCSPIYQKDAFVSSNGTDAEHEMLRGYVAGNWYCPLHTYLFRRESVRSIGPWDPKLKIRQDTDYLIRMLDSGAIFGFVPEGRVYYVLHKGEHIGSAHAHKNKIESLLYFGRKINLVCDKNNMQDALRQWYTQLCINDFVYSDKLGKARIDEAMKAACPNMCYDDQIDRKIRIKKLIKSAFGYRFGASALEWVKYIVRGRA